MDEILNLLSNVSADTFLKLIIGLVSLVVAITVLLTKCYDTFEKWRKKKNAKECQENIIFKSEEQIEKLGKSLETLSSMIELFREESIQRDKIQIRHTIVNCCNEAIERTNIDSSELQALEDLYALYTAEPINGNSYATTLMMKVRKLPIVPKGMMYHEN